MTNDRRRIPGLCAVMLKAMLLWSVILVLAVCNGVLREFVLVPRLGETAGLLSSGILLALLVFGVAYAALPWLALRRTTGLFAVGVAWLLMTLAFEFGLGVLQGKELSEMLAAYCFRDGNLWPLVLLVILFAPYLAARLRGIAE